MHVSLPVISERQNCLDEKSAFYIVFFYNYIRNNIFENLDPDLNQHLSV